MAKTVTTLTGFDTNSGSSAKGPWTLTKFKAADGREYATFKGEIASKAAQLLNQSVEIEYTEKQNGQYTNYTLEGVEAAGAGEVAVVVSETPAASDALTYTSKNDQFRTKEQIMRTDALQGTLTLFGIIGLDPLSSADEFYGWFQSLYTLIEAGEFQTPDVRVEA